MKPVHLAPPDKTGVQTTKKRLNLALQGGGAHGAFTWGVLDRLLDDPAIEFGRVSGTSAGALNGAALVTGLMRGGRSGAKENLALLWQQAAEAGAFMTLLHVPLKKQSLGVWDDAMPLLSPYQTNSFGLDPLRYILSGVADVELLQSGSPALYVNAVNVHTGESRVFGPEDMSLEALLASACAPMTFQAVSIEGQSYWDGSYAGNPMLKPLHEATTDADILLVELTPLHRRETPTTARNILNRINEISSVNSLRADLKELQKINAAAGREALRVHVISLPDSVSDTEVEPSTKRVVDGVMFGRLKDRGSVAADEWLRVHGHNLGVASTCNIDSRFFGLRPFARDVALL